MSDKPKQGRSERGFAAMDEKKQQEIASKGGQSVAPADRSFSRNPALAAAAGRKGGKAVAPEDRSFSRNHELATQAGRKGGEASHGGRGRDAGGSEGGQRGGSGNLAQDRDRAAEAVRKGGDQDGGGCS